MDKWFTTEEVDVAIDGGAGPVRKAVLPPIVPNQDVGATTKSAKVSDTVERIDSKLAAAVASLAEAPAPLPTANLDADAVEGARSFATQLGALASSNDNNDLLAAFLKLQVTEARQDIEFENNLLEGREALRQLTIITVRRLIDNTSSYAILISTRALVAAFERVDRLIEADEATKMQREMRQVAEEQMDGKEDKSVSKEKRERKASRSSTTASVSDDSAEGDLSTMAAFIQGSRLAVAGAVQSLADRHADASGRFKSRSLHG